MSARSQRPRRWQRRSSAPPACRRSASRTVAGQSMAAAHRSADGKRSAARRRRSHDRSRQRRETTIDEAALHHAGLRGRPRRLRRPILDATGPLPPRLCAPASVDGPPTGSGRLSDRHRPRARRPRSRRERQGRHHRGRARARRLAAAAEALEKVPGVEAILTRQTDLLIALPQRTAIANREGAKCPVDSRQCQRQRSGARSRDLFPQLREQPWRGVGRRA